MWAANCMRDYGTTNNTPAHQAPPVWRAPEGLEDLTAAQVGDGGACQHTNDKPDRSGAPRGLRGLAGHHTDTPTDWRPPRGLRGLAAVPVGGGRAWPGFEKTRRANHQHTRLHWCGGHRGPGRGAGGRWWRRTAGVEDTGGPGRGAGGRRQGIEPTRRAPSSAKAQLVWRTPEGTAAVPVGGGRAQPGFKIDHSKPALRIVGCGGGVRSVPGVVDSVVGRRPNTGVRLGCLINQNSHVIWVP